MAKEEWSEEKVRIWQAVIHDRGLPPSRDALDSLIDSYVVILRECDRLKIIKALAIETVGTCRHGPACDKENDFLCCADAFLELRKLLIEEE